MNAAMSVQKPLTINIDQSISNDFYQSGSESPDSGITLFKFVSLGLIIALGSAGNVLVIYAFSRNFKLRRSPYIFMLGFVTLDLIRVCVCYPIVFVTVMHKQKSESHWLLQKCPHLCQLMAFANVFCLFGNSLTLFAMSLDRYAATRFARFHRRRMIRGFFGTAVLFAIWGVSILSTFPSVYIMGSYQYLPAEAQCSFPHHYYKKNSDTLSLLSLFVVIVALSQLVYFKLFLFLRSRRRMRPILYEPAVSEDWHFFGPGATRNIARNQWLISSLSTSAAPLPTIGRNVLNLLPREDRFLSVNSRALCENGYGPRKDENLTKTCFMVNVVFIVMWAPYIVLCFWQTLKYQGGIGRNGSSSAVIPDWLRVSSTWLTYFQVAITPITFFGASGFARRSLFVRRRVPNRRREFTLEPPISAS